MNPEPQLELRHVFKTKGVPTVTYVERNHGKFDQDVRNAFEDAGTLVIITGPSKSGKTTLYRQVFSKLDLELIPIRSNMQLTGEQLWKVALEAVDFERLAKRESGTSTKIHGEAGIDGTIGWSWLAGLIGKFKLGITREVSEREIRERILAEPCSDHLVPILKHLATALLIEDFHYLNEGVQRFIFQSWKNFVDNEISTIVVGTSYRTADLARANPDLIGRLAHIQMESWRTEDLYKVAFKGFDYLNQEVPHRLINLIAKEAVGLPIIVQSVCRQLMRSMGIEKPSETVRKLALEPAHVYYAFHQVAMSSYHGSFSPTYERLAHADSKKAVYGTILAAFVLDPLIFSMDLTELRSRLDRLPLRTDLIPGSDELLISLDGISSIQLEMDVDLLDWDRRRSRLYITEPTFLFYLRWRNLPDRGRPSVMQSLDSLL